MVISNVNLTSTSEKTSLIVSQRKILFFHLSKVYCSECIYIFIKSIKSKDTHARLSLLRAWTALAKAKKTKGMSNLKYYIETLIITLPNTILSLEKNQRFLDNFGSLTPNLHISFLIYFDC
jgi:hypothetical protein